jgi:hypothetical protein
MAQALIDQQQVLPDRLLFLECDLREREAASC